MFKPIYNKIHLFLILCMIFTHCSQNQQNPVAKTPEKNIMLSGLTNNYDFSIDYNGKNQHKITFFNKSKKWITSGYIFQFKTNTPFYVKNMKLSNIYDNNTAQAYFFKLYINDKLTGKFSVGEKIKISKKISSIRLLFLKTNNEYLVEGWKENTLFRFLKINDGKKKIFSPRIKLFILSKQKLKVQIFNTRKLHDEKLLQLNQKFINRFNGNSLMVSGLHHKKEVSIRIQYSVNVGKDGSFVLYQLIGDNIQKKIIREFFIEGNWQCTSLYNNLARLEFKGKLTGYFPKRKTKIIHGEFIKIKSVFSENLLQSDKLLHKIYFDFPDDALVNVKSLIPGLIVDMAYAAENNFTGERLYPCNKCFLRYEVAKALKRVQKNLEKNQMSLKLFDCYRPFSVQALMFKKFPIPGYVADSIGGSSHNRGSAVDLTIIDKNGNALDMGTGFDELSAKSNHNYLYFSDTILKNRLFLKELMQSCNFTPIRSEWWHYNYLYGRKFPKIDDEFLCN